MTNFLGRRRCQGLNRGCQLWKMQDTYKLSIFHFLSWYLRKVVRKKKTAFSTLQDRSTHSEAYMLGVQNMPGCHVIVTVLRAREMFRKEATHMKNRLQESRNTKSV